MRLDGLDQCRKIHLPDQRTYSDHILSSVDFNVPCVSYLDRGWMLSVTNLYNIGIYKSYIAAAPPLNVQATQASASTPVKVRWSPHSIEAATITGYIYTIGTSMDVDHPYIYLLLHMSLELS